MVLAGLIFAWALLRHLPVVAAMAGVALILAGYRKQEDATLERERLPRSVPHTSH
jgi:hypothetical protein